MKKVLALLNALVITTVGVGSIVSCQKVNNDNNIQVSIATENLTAFFATNKTFVYKREFFFKDESLQSEEDTEWIQYGWVSILYTVIIDNTFGQVFNAYFIYLPNEFITKNNINFSQENFENNNSEILKAISENYFKTFSNDEKTDKWFYYEIKIKVVDNSYEYLGKMPVVLLKGGQAKANLTFSCLNNDQITTIRDVELWMDNRNRQFLKW
ncbi:hypothetical protein S100390_v1c04170 [Spiroplasma sp. NBRC 100390]|uniref:hypothetical protein n=1 Tax=unclassified Spiroplasma TaxID=2637901 RepID=UPI0008928C11|nr:MULTISPECIES: hypothetical protein [unclassified Spiroplasma]AOX43760.1 hypothetical protein STU14_v1c04170 [Spiroplasma sp. TU-14]APE13230.1 hypothetical protein S100390_v1c04170 [Spiroplasma sp. NBRC 100390]